jgi:hypothetical protein
MIIDISNEVYTKLKTELVGVEIGSTFLEAPSTYPFVTFSEVSNTAFGDTKDSSGEQHNQLAFEVNIFTIGDDKKSQAKNLRKMIDDVLSGYYNMDRDFSDEIPNFLNQNVYRYVMRYSCLVDKNKVIYGR